jgi:competence protein ComEC
VVHLPLLVSAVIGAGALAGVWFPASALIAAVLGGAAVAAAAVAFSRGLGAVMLLAGVVAAASLAMARGGMAFASAASPTLVQMLDRAGLLADDGPRPHPVVVLTGRLDADAVVEGPSVLLRLAVTDAGIGACACPLPVAGRVLVAVAGDLAAARAGEWRAGRTIRLAATVRRPVTARNLGAPDAAHDLVRRRLALTASVKSGLLVESIAIGSWAEEAAAAIRARARRAIARAAGPEAPEPAAIGTAVLIGDRAGLTPELTARLQRAGTFHVIAISGGNIALLSLITVWTVGRMCGSGRVTAFVAALILVAYAGVVGGGASVLRATGMAVVGLAARAIDQRGVALNVLALTGAALLVADPLLAVDTGFWLTTAATAGLVVGLGDRDEDHTRWRRMARALVLASVWAELALLPIVAAAFQQVTVAGVLLSAFAIPGMAVAQMAAMAAVAADLVVPALLPAAGLALRVGATVVTESARVVDVLPFLSWRVPPPHVAAVIAYYAALGLWLWARVLGHGAVRARLHPVALGGLATAALWVAVAPASLVVWPQPSLDVTVLDVGQGDAVVLRFPDGTTMLVDAGGRPGGSRFDVGSRVVGPALRARGIRRLDYLVVTHADADHIGGAISIVEEFRPGEVWTGVPVAGDAATAALRLAAAGAGVAWREVQRGDRVAFGAAEIAVLHPPPPDWERQRVRNDDSVVLAVSLGTTRALLMGDVTAAVEAEIAGEAARAWTRVTSGPPRITALKVAHHGSAGSTTPAFLQSTMPVIGLVSAGLDDPFGHPASPTLTRLDAAGVDVWRTDRDGEVTLSTDGQTVWVRGFSGRQRRWTPAPLPP